MKKLISLALAGGMVLSLAACGSSASTAASTATESTSTAESTAESTASEGKQLKIAFFMYENSNTFTTYIRKGLENYGAENNVVVDSFDGKSDQSTQTDAITTTLAKGGYDLIVVNPVDSGAGETINNLCRQYDIPVIYADRAPDLVGGILDDYEQAYYVGLDWSDPGAVQAQMVYDAWTADSSKLDKNGDGVLQYVLLQGNVAQQNAIYRTAAINELFEGWAADGTMKTEQLDIQDGNWSSDKGKDVMDAWNVKFGDEIEAVLCNNDTMAMGAIESLNSNPLSGFTKTYSKFCQGTIRIGNISLSYLMFYAIAVVAVMWVIWNRTTLGKNMFAIGGNREAAKVCGVNVKRTIIIVYIIAGLLYAFGGVLEAGRTGSANSTMGADYAMDAIAACVVGGVSMKGGTGTLPGVVIGVIIFQIISYGLIYIGVSPDLQYVVKGLIIIVAVVLDNQKSLRKAA